MLPPLRIGTAWCIALAVSAACAAVAVASAAILWNMQRQAGHELERALASVRQNPQASAPPEPAYAPIAREAAKLMQRPIDGWLRELERCQPEQARLRELRVDAKGGRVAAQVELQGDLALAPWLQCLNAGLNSPVWRTGHVSAATDAVASMSHAWRPAWAVVLERVE
ncbi:MAG TPA: hypothetical protein VD932_06015 [Aquabacterium sp.]|nr:hypothetical protein [Aquabacterium sp.]